METHRQMDLACVWLRAREGLILHPPKAPKVTGCCHRDIVRFCDTEHGGCDDRGFPDNARRADIGDWLLGECDPKPQEKRDHRVTRTSSRNENCLFRFQAMGVFKNERFIVH